MPYESSEDPNYKKGMCQGCGVKPIDKAWSRFYCKECDKKYGVF